MSRNHKDKNNGNGRGQLGFETQLCATADMGASEYKHVCLGLVSLKYISDAFEEKGRAGTPRRQPAVQGLRLTMVKG